MANRCIRGARRQRRAAADLPPEAAMAMSLATSTTSLLLSVRAELAGQGGRQVGRSPHLGGPHD